MTPAQLTDADKRQLAAIKLGIARTLLGNAQDGITNGTPIESVMTDLELGAMRADEASKLVAELAESSR